MGTCLDDVDKIDPMGLGDLAWLQHELVFFAHDSIGLENEVEARGTHH